MTTIVYSPQYLDHYMGPHPECPERLARIVRKIEECEIDLNWVEPKPATRKDLLLAHSAGHIRNIREKSAGGKAVDLDTLCCRETYRVAKLAAGGVLKAAEVVFNNEDANSFALVRPPGHHASRESAGGFCFFNNVAIASLKFKDVAILDIDAHNGNGSQSILYDKPIMYCSLHQEKIYPGTGLKGEHGSGKGLGYNFNYPLPAGTRDKEYLEAVYDAFCRIDNVSPKMIIVSAGFDGHEFDPLAGLKLSGHAYRRIAEILRPYPQVWALEGGYNLNVLGECVLEVLKAWL